MARWSAYGGLDSRLLIDGDRRFTGLDMTRDRALLPPGTLAVSKNKRLRNGSADTRKGNIAATDFMPAFEDVIIGSGIYSNPNADEVMLIATLGATYVWACQYGKDPVKIQLATGENLANLVSVRFCQAFDKVLLLRRLPGGHTTLEWNGNTDQTNAANKFKPVALSSGGDVGSGTALIPTTTDGEPFQSRVLLYNTVWPPLPWRDQMIMTDILDYTRYDPVYNVFRINAGESDYITRIWPYYRGSIVGFKKNTIHALNDFTIDPSFGTQTLLSKRMGLAAPFAVVEDGNDLLFLAEPGGIYRLSEVIQEQIGAQAVPVSDPIQPIIDQIDWLAAANFMYGGGARAETLGEDAYFALPIGNTAPHRGNNTIVVYNTASKQWQSVDSWADSNFKIDALHVTRYHGARSLFALDYTNKQVYVLYQAEAYDEVGQDIWPIQDAMETRGYTCEDAASFKNYRRAPITIRTSNPEVYVSAVADGVNEVKPLTPVPIRKDRTKFYQHGHPDFTPSDDPFAPKRQDYSQTDIGNFAGEDFEGLPIGPISEIPPSISTTTTGPRQQTIERPSIRVNARWVSIRIQNMSGVCDVLAVGVEATPSAMETKTAA